MPIIPPIMHYLAFIITGFSLSVINYVPSSHLCLEVHVLRPIAVLVRRKDHCYRQGAESELASLLETLIG